jgi:DnaJ-class molecular chaperone
VPKIAPAEILALERIIDGLDYYQILHVAMDAKPSEIRAAYHASARTFHPDVSGHLDTKHREAIRGIAKRVAEAYSVLRDPRRRKVYDAQLRADSNDVRMRISDAEAKAEKSATEELQGRTPNGRRYFTLAQSDLAKSDYAAAARNLQTALAFESDNELFRRKLEEVRQLLR